jgi:hypothetical protein
MCGSRGLEGRSIKRTGLDLKEKPPTGLQHLLGKPEDQGYLTMEDVLEIFPWVENDVPELEELVMYLYDHLDAMVTADGKDGQGKAPSVKEIGTRMGISPARVRWMMAKSRRALSLEKPVGEAQESQLGQFIEDEDSPAPAEIAAQSLLADKLKDLLATLTPREERIVRLRYGLEDGRA